MSPLALSLRLLQAQPDERLLALARSGHEPAFEALVRRYRRALLAYCRRLIPQEASAEDILQQALLLAWRALSTGAEVRDARPWLYRIVHNVAISTIRGGAETPTELGEAIGAAGVEQLVEQRLAAREALAGLAALPELQRQVMLSTAVDGRSHQEIASDLGLTSGSVRGLIYRARATLRAAAAALIPAPLIDWAARQDYTATAGSSGIYEALAGGGSAGIVGAVLKGGALVTVAGALAGTAAVVTSHPGRHHSQAARPSIVRSAFDRDSGATPAWVWTPVSQVTTTRTASHHTMIVRGAGSGGGAGQQQFDAGQRAGARGGDSGPGGDSGTRGEPGDRDGSGPAKQTSAHSPTTGEGTDDRSVSGGSDGASGASTPSSGTGTASTGATTGTFSDGGSGGTTVPQQSPGTPSTTGTPTLGGFSGVTGISKTGE